MTQEELDIIVEQHQHWIHEMGRCETPRLLVGGWSVDTFSNLALRRPYAKTEELYL